MNRRSNLATAVYLLLVFLSGALVGVFAYRLYTVNTVVSSSARPRRTPEEYRKRYVEEMTSRLKLSADQVTDLQQIMDGTGRRFRELHEGFRQETKSIEADHYQQVRAMLSDGQQAEYEKMRAEREERRKAREKEKEGGRKPPAGGE